MGRILDGRKDRGQATRGRIIETAAFLFTTHGYEAVSTEMILQSCGLSRGALYYHFASKEAVFTAVLEATEQRIVSRLAAAASDKRDPIEGLRAGCAAWLALAAEDDAVRRIVLTDAPGAIGWKAWRALDERYTLGLIRGGLSAVAAKGRLREDRVDVLAHLLLAVLVEAALLIARAPEDASVARVGHEAVEQILDGLVPEESRLRAR